MPENCVIRGQIKPVKLSVIIVNYNVRYFLEHCLNAVRKACKNIEAEIFVVDNASTDGSREFLEGRFSNVTFIWNETNLGFSKANNLALALTKGDYVLFLNPDTIVAEDSFEKCIDYFATHADCGAMGVHMIDGAGNFLKESKRSFPEPMTSFYKMTGLCNLFPASKTFAKYYAGHLPENKTASVEVLSGAYMMISRKILNRTGGFDEQYFMYGEDIDLSYRIKKTGFKNIYFADTTIIHFKGESTQKNTAEYTSHFYGAMKLFVKKHYHESKLTQSAMYAAIGFGKFLANVKRKIKNAVSLSSNNNHDYSLLIAAGQEKFNQMIQLLKFSKKSFVICGRIIANENDIAPATCTLNNVKEIIKKEKIKYVLFCQGDLTYASIINQFKLLNKSALFLIHSLHCNAIIGSNNKDKSGIVIVEE